MAASDRPLRILRRRGLRTAVPDAGRSHRGVARAVHQPAAVGPPVGRVPELAIRAGRGIRRRHRRALGHGVARGGRRIAMEPARRAAVAAAGGHAPAVRVGAILPGPGHQRAAGAGRRDRLAAGAARDASRREHRARPDARALAAGRGLPQGLRPSARAAREPAEHAGRAAGTEARPHRGGAGCRGRGRRRTLPELRNRGPDGMAELHALTGARPGGRRVAESQLGPARLRERGAAVARRSLGGIAGRHLAPGLADDRGRVADARAVPAGDGGDTQRLAHR